MMTVDTPHEKQGRWPPFVRLPLASLIRWCNVVYTWTMLKVSETLYQLAVLFGDKNALSNSIWNVNGVDIALSRPRLSDTAEGGISNEGIYVETRR